jgi:hypothetical protein
LSASDSYQFQAFYGRAIAPHIGDVAKVRIEQFRHYPYLYDGSLAYEETYLAGYVNEPRAQLIVVRHMGSIAAVATAVPLSSSSDIVADAPVLFASAGHNPTTFYYYAEIIVLPEHRGNGLAPRIYAMRAAAARDFGYRHLCLAVVDRPSDHPLRPSGYVGPERVWIKDGFQKTDIRFTYDWPTIQADGKTIDQANAMVFWIRSLQ